jgi:hypothetical protein
MARRVNPGDVRGEQGVGQAEQRGGEGRMLVGEGVDGGGRQRVRRVA